MVQKKLKNKIYDTRIILFIKITIIFKNSLKRRIVIILYKFPFISLHNLKNKLYLKVNMVYSFLLLHITPKILIIDFIVFMMYNNYKVLKMFIKRNELIAVYVNVSWKTSFSIQEYLAFEEFIKKEYFKKGNRLIILLTDSCEDIFPSKIKFLINPKEGEIKCPQGIGVKEVYDYLSLIMNKVLFEELSDLTHQYFNFLDSQNNIEIDL